MLDILKAFLKIQSALNKKCQLQLQCGCKIKLTLKLKLTLLRDPAGTRTQDPYIKSVLLYQLSYGILPFKAAAKIEV